MLSLKTIILSLTVVSFLSSCSKKEGCNFNEALNYDNLVVVDDGSCRFTHFTFYADTTYLNGMLIEKVAIKIANKQVGTFSNMETSGSACSGLNTTTYSPKSVENVFWTSEIHLLDSLVDSVIVTSGEVRTSPNLECYAINVLL